MTSSTHQLLAAVDLGSNSFHMVVAREVGGDLQVVDRLKERVQLAGGLDDANRLTVEVQGRALAVLERFGQRLRGLRADRVRALGTSALRRAINAPAFLRRAEEALGHPIEIVSGQEEARLIYLGVAHTVAAEPARRLVIDIGGGSTELIVGQGFEAETRESLPMGCVSWSLRFLPAGDTRADGFKRAILAAKREIQTVAHRFVASTWDVAYGSSGTVGAVDELLTANRWSDGGVTLAGLGRLQRTLEAAGRIDAARLPGLKAERASVLPGGLAILTAVMESLSVSRLSYATGAMREGVLYDQIGRIRHEDIRDRTTRRMCAQYMVDLRQSERVEQTATRLLQEVAFAWDLEGESTADLLRWAARLHEIGLAVSHSGYHKHGGYLVEHSDMPGFSNHEQALLATLVRAQRKALSDELFAPLPDATRDLARRLAVLLRLAVVLHRGRQHEPVPLTRIEVRGRAVRLRFEPGWLDGHALTLADLEAERDEFAKAGFKLEFA
jgi:exopolyphosphatase/guanosine-5'-triphosphate,3'-diphosphate pyrophosphatase